MLVKQANRPTKFILPCKFKTKEGKEIYRNRYYVNEFELFKAYRQLKAIKGSLIPLYPIIDEIIYKNI